MAELYNKPNNTITFVVGPTASGKTAWALVEAIKEGGAICNADSLQVFIGLDVGTAKPTITERSKLPHYLFDLVAPDQTFTAGDYRRAALQVIEAHIQNQPLYFVGGSGFYIQALEKGMPQIQEPTEETEAQLDRWEEAGTLRAELQKVDPKAFDRISANDVYRTRRALEVFLTEGKTLDELKLEHGQSGENLNQRYNVKKIGIQISREALRKNVQARTEWMLKNGLIEEVEGLIRAGFSLAKPLKSVGYKECLDFLEGRLQRSELAFAIETATMQLAKRQMTWFRRDKEIEWIEAAT